MKKLTRILLVALFWLSVWQLLAWNVGKELLLPSPYRVLITLWNLILTTDFWSSIFFSIIRVVIGIVVALFAGTLVAILTSRWKPLREVIAPFITVIRSTPVASFILLLWLWLGADKLPAIICLLMVFPIAWSAASDAISALDKNLAEVCKVYRLSLSERIIHFYIPSFFPYFLSASKTSIGLAWKAAVAAETLVVSPHSIGRHLFDTKITLETPELFAWTLVVILLSLVIESITSLALGKLGQRFVRTKKI